MKGLNRAFNRNFPPNVSGIVSMLHNDEAFSATATNEYTSTISSTAFCNASGTVPGLALDSQQDRGRL